MIREKDDDALGLNSIGVWSAFGPPLDSAMGLVSKISWTLSPTEESSKEDWSFARTGVGGEHAGAMNIGSVEFTSGINIGVYGGVSTRTCMGILDLCDRVNRFLGPLLLGFSELGVTGNSGDDMFCLFALFSSCVSELLSSASL